MTPSPTIAPPNEAPLEDLPGSPFDTVRRFRHALTPFPRAGLFYVRSWANWLRHRGDDGVPAPFPSLLLTGHAFADEAVIAGFRVTKAPSPVSSVLRAELEARAALELYAERGFLVDPASFHPAPPGIEKPTARWDRTRHRRYEPFPGEDVMDNVHGIAQSVWDVRRLVRWAASQGTGPVGITGVSLGGFVTALVAGLEPDLACAILGVPAVDLIDLIDHHSTRGHDPQSLRMADLARQFG